LDSAEQKGAAETRKEGEEVKRGEQDKGEQREPEEEEEEIRMEEAERGGRAWQGRVKKRVDWRVKALREKRKRGEDKEGGGSC